MTQSQKALALVKQSYMPKKKKLKKIIKQEKNIIQAKAKTNKAKAEETVQTTQLDDNVKQFIDKYIEYTQLNLLNSSAEQLTATFEKTLGQNASKAIDTLLTKIKQRDSKIKELSKELIALKQQMIKQTQKARAKVTLITLADQIPVEKEMPKAKKNVNLDKEKITNVINSQSKKKK